MQRRQVVRCPFRVDLEADQIVDPLHLFLQDALPRLDRRIGFCQRFQADDRLDSQFGAFVLRHCDAVVAFELDADFIRAGHTHSLRREP